MRKRIGVFMSEVASEYQKLVLKSIFKRAKELNYDVFVFATYGSYGDNVLYAEGEMGMLSLPVLSELDGIIVGEDTLDIAGMESELEALLRREAKCPVVYLRAVKEDFYNIRLEDERAMEDVTRHFVYKHGFRDICFMGGKKWTTDAHDRYNGFLKVMREVGVEVTEHMVFEGDYWRNKGKEAVDWFMEGRDSYPQAIICANDFMAISICEELDRRGVNVPSQVCVSGYDNITEARLNHPSLTSVSIPFEIIATKAVEMIDNVCSGREQQRVEWIHFEFLESESCGCGKAEALRNWSWMPRKMYKQDNNLKQVVFMTTDYQGVFEGKDYLRVAEKYIYNISFEKAFLCMCDKEDGHETEGYYSEEMTLRRVYTADHKTLKKDLRFYRKDLLPKDECDTDEPQAYFLFSIHHKNKCFGYLVLTLQEDKWLDAFTQAYLMSLANAIEDAQMHQEVSVL